MSIITWLRTPRIRRGLAASVVVLAAGGLILVRSAPNAAGAGGGSILGTHTPLTAANGNNSTTFTGPGAHGTIALSHKNVMRDQRQTVVADVRLVADASDGARDRQRAPLAIAVVLDTSGSMSGEKLEQAKSAVTRLVGDMRDDDQITVVRYSDDSSLVQPLARVGDVRGALASKISELTAGGGTAIPVGLAHGLRALEEATRGRVRRVVLVSDGIDATRAEAERLSKASSERGITTSSLGIGLDFDESYMGGVARAGHGNFGFVKDASALATFLRRELDETASTTIEAATVRLTLPSCVRFVRANGAEARDRGDGTLELSLGSLFAGDERRVLVELEARLRADEACAIAGRATWDRVGGGSADVTSGPLSLVATNEARDVDATRDPSVLASFASVTASQRQLEAADAYAHGDTAKADALIGQNLAALQGAAAVAPPSVAASLAKQMHAYRATKSSFAAAAPTSTAGKAAAKGAAEKDSSNLAREAAF